MNWYLEVLRKYAVFQGRARRREYWFFVLFNLLISLALGALDGILGTFDAQAGIGVLGGLYALAVFIPALAVTVRRLHDIDRSGWWILIGFIPLIGAIILLVFLVLDSNSGSNRFGENPKDHPHAWA